MVNTESLPERVVQLVAEPPQRAELLRARGFITTSDQQSGQEVRLTAEGRAATLLIHAASKAIEADLLGRLEPAEALAFKHLIRRFIVQTDTGLPHPWQSAE